MKKDIYNIKEWTDTELKELQNKIINELEYRKNSRLETLKERVWDSLRDLAEFVRDEHLSSAVGWVEDGFGGDVKVDIEDLLNWFEPSYN